MSRYWWTLEMNLRRIPIFCLFCTYLVLTGTLLTYLNWHFFNFRIITRTFLNRLWPKKINMRKIVALDSPWTKPEYLPVSNYFTTWRKTLGLKFSIYLTMLSRFDSQIRIFHWKLYLADCERIWIDFTSYRCFLTIADKRNIFSRSKVNRQKNTCANKKHDSVLKITVSIICYK